MAMRGERFLYAGGIDTRLPWGLGPQTHPHHELILVLAGGMTLRLGGREWAAREGEALLYRAGEAHEEHSWQEPPFQSLFVGFEAVDLPACISTVTEDSAGRLRLLARWLLDERDAVAPEAGAARALFLRALLGELVRLSTSLEEPWVRTVRHYIRRHLAQPLTVDMLAAQLGVSKYHFIRRYQAATGLTPMADVRRIRSEAARDLVLSTNLSLKQVADHCGLGNASHFSHVLRRSFGVSPRQLRTNAAHGLGKRP